MRIKEKLWNEAEKRQAEIVNLAANLVKIPSINPPGDTTEIASFVREHLKEHGISVELYESKKGHISLVAKLGSQTGNSLAFNGHLDVVPVGDESKWSFPPFSGEVKNGYLLGRGSSDMKGGVAAQIATLEILSDLDIPLNGQILLMLVPDEETGGKFGTKWLLENTNFSIDGCITGEPSGPEYVDIGEKGIIWHTIVVHGVPGHGSLAPFIGDNAILKAYTVIEKLMELTKIEAHAPSDIAYVIDESMPIVEKIHGISGVGVVLKRPTINIGVISGGVKRNVVPDKCTLEIDLRIPIGLDVNSVFTKLKQIINSFGNDVELQNVEIAEPNYTSPQTELVQVLMRNAVDVLGKSPQLFVDYATSDAKYYRMRGIPTMHYGPNVINGHGYDERVKVDEILTVTKVYLGTAVDFLG